MISMISKPHKWLTNKRAAGMDEQRVLLYRRSEFGISPIRGSLLVCNDLGGIGSSFTRNTPPTRKSARDWNFFEDASTPPPSRNLVSRNSGSFRCSTNFIYLFFFFSSLSARIESSLHSPTLGLPLKLRNYDGNRSSIRECCTNMSVPLLPSSFPLYNLRPW